MSSSITQNDVVRLLQGQCRSADLWIDQWNRHKDPAALRNVSMALGKINGIYNVLIFMIEGFENLPDGIINLVNKYNKIWEELYLPERN